MQAVARCKQLQPLHISGIDPVKCEAVAAMTQLQELSVQSTCGPQHAVDHAVEHAADHAELAQAASRLRLLRTLLLPGWRAQPGDWQQLASMAQLSRLELQELTLCTSGPGASQRSSGITSLSADWIGITPATRPPAAPASGDLTHLLPAGTSPTCSQRGPHPPAARAPGANSQRRVGL
jgi:hypothetical protein